ncbi:MAG: AAA family ATPase [Pseudomonadota bacterium]
MSLRFDAIRLRHVRGFGADGMALEGLSPGLNVLSQPNEFGKSTILAALKAALFYKATADNKIVKSLYGVDGDPPEIELDFTAEDKARRLSKRFRKGRGETKLFALPGLQEIAREADAEAEIFRLIGADKPTHGAGGLLWVEQGTALDGLQDAHKTTIAEALASEATDVASSEDALRLTKAVATELAELETAKTGKPTKRLLAALTDQDDAEAALHEANATLAEAQSYRSRLIELEAQLAKRADADDDAAFQKELKEAQSAAAELQKRAETVGHTEREVARLAAARDHAVAAHERFTSDLKHLKELDEKIGMASRREAELVADRGHTAAFTQELAEKLTALKTRHRKLTTNLRQADAFERFARAKAEHDAAEEALGEVRRLMSEKQVAEAIAARGAINLKALQKLERDMLVADAALDAASPEVELLAGEGAALEGETLIMREPRRVRGAAELVVGEARVAIRAAIPRDLHDQRERASAELSSLLEASGVRSIEDAQVQATARRDAAGDVKRLTDEIKRLAPKGLSALEMTSATVPQAPDGEPPKEGRDALEKALTAIDIELEPAQTRLDEARDREQGAEKQLIACRAELQITQTQRTELADKLGDADQQAATEASLAAKVAEHVALLSDAERDLETLKLEQKDLDAAARRVKRLEEAAANRARDLTQLKVDIGQLEGQLMQVYQQGPEESRDAAAERLEVARARLDRLEARRRALKRLLQTLAEVQSERRDRLLKPLVDASAPLVEQVFGDSSLRFGADLSPEKLGRPGREQAVDVLSAGAQEQIAIVTRLGMARLFASRDQAVPLILDDALIYADDSRTDRLFGTIQWVAEETQVIVLTCHERRFDALGGHRLRPMPFPVLA